ncbi:MAG: ABC transporter ATP-binding protein [Deltaproteobacteria bacterium]|nr:ABC transporter ATP-binding protein [Deltaproteobacteria bacterium]
MIEVEHLSKYYGERLAVSDLHFQVQAGEIIGFLGPNGAGKSTTLRMIAGFLPPSAGRIRIDGIDILEHPAEAKRRIGYMPEAVPLYPEMRVSEYLRFRAELKGVPRSKIASRIEESLHMAGAAEVANRIIGQLSKGTRQRVGLADALVADPPVLILDEPTAGLDPNQIREVRRVIRSLYGKKTVILSTHILPEVEASSTRILIIHRGRLVCEGPPDRIRSMALRPAFLLLSRASHSQILSALEGLPGLPKVHARGEREGELCRYEIEFEESKHSPEELGELIFKHIAKAGLSLSELRIRTSLEDVFSALTTSEPVEEGGKSPLPPSQA